MAADISDHDSDAIGIAVIYFQKIVQIAAGFIAIDTACGNIEPFCLRHLFVKQILLSGYADSKMTTETNKIGHE